MKIEKLNYGKEKNKRMFLYGFIVAVVLLILVNIIASKAMYRRTESVQLATGTVNYSLADLNIIAMYQEKDSYNTEEDKYKSIEEIPTKGYTLNKEKSVCKVNNDKEEEIEIKIINNKITISNMTKKGTKCYLYFDKYVKSGMQTLADLKLNKDGILGDSVTGTACNNGCTITNQNGIYETEDDDGKSYIFRGTVDNNWLKFGKIKNSPNDIWWRIIRINGDGTIRIIYAGEGTNFGTTGNGTNALNYVAYNTNYNDNTYVGYYYGSTGGNDFKATHSNSTPSDIASATNNWFSNTTNLNETTQLNHIDENAGFCNNRQISTNVREWWTGEGTADRGTGTVVTAYKGMYNTQTATAVWRTDVNYASLKCSSSANNFEDNEDYKRDYYTLKEKATRGNKALDYPVGQITMDEVILAGGFGGKSNSGYWLTSKTTYWTMSPRYMFTLSYVGMFTVNSNGYLGDIKADDTTIGIRPVINLKPDNVTLQNPNGDNKGTTSNPYIVSD